MKRVGALAVLLLSACTAREPAPVPPLPPGAVAAPDGTVIPPPPEPPAVVVRVKQVNGRFVAEVVDVRGSTTGTPAPDAASRKEAVDRVQGLFGDRARVVDPHAAR